MWLQLTVCKKVDNLSLLRQKLYNFVLLVVLTWSCVRSCSKILQKRLKRRHALPSARQTAKESSLGQRVKNHGNCWLTSPKRRFEPKKKPFEGACSVSGNRCKSRSLFKFHFVWSKWVICDRTLEFPGPVLLYNKISAPSRWELICWSYWLDTIIKYISCIAI